MQTLVLVGYELLYNLIYMFHIMDKHIPHFNIFMGCKEKLFPRTFPPKILNLKQNWNKDFYIVLYEVVIFEVLVTMLS